MSKHYIIPINAAGEGLFGIKALTNPYNGLPYSYCAGCLNIIGGNLDGRSIPETLWEEAQEETHGKLDLEQVFIQSALGATPPHAHFRQIHHVPVSPLHPIAMTFYAMRGHFALDQLATIPNIFRRRPEYRETTGEVVRVNLHNVNRAHTVCTSGDALSQMPLPARRNISTQAHSQFLVSETATAIRTAAHAVFMGQI